MYGINLLRERKEEESVWVDSFVCQRPIMNPEAALRAAVKEFLATSEGKKAINETMENFNWGDAIMYVPDEIWEKHGLKLLQQEMVDVSVNQDEVLCVEEGIVDEACSKCDEEVVLENSFSVQVCPSCKEPIKPCSLCDMDVVNCEECPLDNQ